MKRGRPGLYVAYFKEEKLRRLELNSKSKLAAEDTILEGGDLLKDEVVYERARIEYVERVYPLKKGDA